MPNLKIRQLGKPTVEGFLDDCVTFAEGFRALGLPEPKDGTLMVNGATPVKPTDRINRDTVVHYNAALKGAR